MHCTLCEKPIQQYDPAFHHVVIDETHAVDICSRCADILTRWQIDRGTRLFPTHMAKKFAARR